MDIKVFAVFDSKMAIFGQPFFDQKEASAIRNFSDAVNDSSNPNNMWNKHPEDFSLFLLGEYDNQSGELIPCTPKSLVTASALIALDYGDGANAVKIQNRNSKKVEELIQ